MAIQLEKRKPISIIKEKPGLNNIIAGLGWDPATVNGHSVDLDLSLFMLGADGKLVEDEYFIFYNNATSPDGSTHYPGDSRGGEGEGDDEVINIELSKINPKVEFLYFAVTIDQCEERVHNFGHVQNSYINIRNAADNSVLCQYKLQENFTNEDSLIIASISRNGGAWDVEALGQAFSGGLNTLVELYQ
ncbi:TerD family protein [Pedobacter hartonius]|uniref:Tellurium resistance protein TerD n=1 Tax=Pedobacter hartonius TaxID=425514 RepID=A0A1H4HFW5_9SPHI|nr:TerD family protein [Pedobacter hartonius]SEB20704.1 tellurium resistance protein TerD [Pedobacter hartonius]